MPESFDSGMVKMSLMSTQNKGSTVILTRETHENAQGLKGSVTN